MCEWLRNPNSCRHCYVSSRLYFIFLPSFLHTPHPVIQKQHRRTFILKLHKHTDLCLPEATYHTCRFDYCRVQSRFRRRLGYRHWSARELRVWGREGEGLTDASDVRRGPKGFKEKGQRSRHFSSSLNGEEKCLIVFRTASVSCFN